MRDAARARPRDRGAHHAGAVALLAALLPSGGAGADDGYAAGARHVGPVVVQPTDFRLDDGRLDLSAPGCGCRIEGPAQPGPRAPIRAIPYRVEPRAGGAPPSSPWDLPPETPDPRDFERLETLDEEMNPQYELREEIWATPEDFVAPWGSYGSWGSRHEGGIAYVPYWARNTVRYGRLQFFPWIHGEAVWHSNPRGETGSGHDAFEFVASAGSMAEMWVEPGRTKVKGVVRADYHTWDGEFDDSLTYLLGASVEQRVNRYVTLSAGVEWEEDYLAVDRNASLLTDHALVQRFGAYGSLAWDRFLTDCTRLEIGGTWERFDEVGSAEHGGDHEDTALFARLGWSIMRHESFAYGEYRYETRTAEGDSSALSSAHEVRVGVENVLPQDRTRRVVGNVWAGYRWEAYDAASTSGSVGAGDDDKLSTWTAGADLTYKPSPYTSAYLSYQHANEFSAVANYNTVDSVYLAVTENFSHRLIGRLATSWTRVEPQNDDASNRWTIGAGLRFALCDNVDLSADYEYSHRWAGATLDESDGHRVAMGATWYLR